MARTGEPARRAAVPAPAARPDPSADAETQRLRDHAEAAADWFWEMDAGLFFTRMQPSSQLPDIYSGRDFIGSRLGEVPGLDVLGGDWQPLFDLLQARLPFRDVRLRFRSEERGTLHLSVSGLPVFDGAGQFTGYRGIGRDITLLVHAEESLAEKTALLHATLDNMEQGLLVLDGEHRVGLWNDRLCDLFDLPAEAIWAGRPIVDLVKVSPAGAALWPGRTVPGEPETCELQLPSGRFIERRLNGMPAGGMLATYRDISARVQSIEDLSRAKEEAELASRSKSEFLANMSHELRTPLNAIIGFADILNGEIFGRLGDARYVEYAGDIRDSGLHLLNLINDVLDVSKIEFGKVELVEESVDLASVVDACLRLMRDRADVAGVRLQQILPADLPLLQGDERRLKQILLNLLSNSVKFTLPGGCVTVRAAADPSGLRIIVEDSGIGIAPRDIDKAMRPFGQIDSSHARKYQGTGLGLPLTKSMIELHGGRLELKSLPGVGTTATVWLPVERLIGVPRPALRRVAEG
jgi:signal transduction histidine kinase